MSKIKTNAQGADMYISSEILVGELYSDYNIQSNDYIARMPLWICNALDDLNILQAYKDLVLEDVYSNNLYYLEGHFKNIDKVKINGEIAIRIDRNTKCFEKSGTPTYRVYNNYIHINEYTLTDATEGDITIYYTALEFVINEQGMGFPLIMNDAVLKQALKYYILRHMLQRGFKHELLNLRENNQYTNPAYAYDLIRHRVKTSVNKFDEIRREAIAEINTSF